MRINNSLNTIQYNLTSQQYDVIEPKAKKKKNKEKPEHLKRKLSHD